MSKNQGTTALVAGIALGVIIGVTTLHLFPLLVLGTIVYLIYLTTSNQQNSSSKEITNGCKTGEQKK